MFRQGCPCIGIPPCPSRRGSRTNRAFMDIGAWNTHNRRYHWALTFNPITEIMLPSSGWSIRQAKMNYWIIQRSDLPTPDNIPVENVYMDVSLATIPIPPSPMSPETPLIRRIDRSVLNDLTDIGEVIEEEEVKEEGDLQENKEEGEKN